MFKKMSRTVSIGLAIALLVIALVPAHAQDQKTFKIWHYEKEDSAMGQSWADAQADFEAAHPDVKVDFELKTFDQIQQTGQMILNSDDVPDVMEINKGNATAGLYAK